MSSLDVLCNRSVLGKCWRESKVNERELYKIINEYNVSEFLARLLVLRNITAEYVYDFLSPKIRSLLPDPFHLIDMQKACDRALLALQKKEKVVIFGDYDVDGATSSAVLYRLLSSLGYDVEIYIPNRITEGYGPSSYAMNVFKSKGISLVFTLDCGAVAIEPIAYAKQLGLDVIIIDHHLTDSILPDAVAIVNPNRLDQITDCRNLAAVGVTFLFCVALVKSLRLHGFFVNRKEPNLLTLLDLVALGTVCDMVPITGLNRAYVAQGLKVMNTSSNIGIVALKESANILDEVSVYHLGFMLGPRINAGGRVGDSSLGARLLSIDSYDDAIQIAMRLESYNNDRKILEENSFLDAMQQALIQIDKSYIFVSSATWHSGVIGIVAGRLKEKFHKPVIVVSLDEKYGKASCRSISSIDIGAKILEAKLHGILIAGGGHRSAAGFTIDRDRIPDLISFFDNSIAQQDVISESFYDIQLYPTAINAATFAEIESVGPFGQGNNEPIIRVDGLVVIKANIVGEKHVSCLLGAKNKLSEYNIDDKRWLVSGISGIAFNALSSGVGEVLLGSRGKELSVYCNIKQNTWKGNKRIQLSIIDVVVGVY